MNTRHLLAVALVAFALVVGGCKSSSGSKSGDSLTGGQTQVPGFFHEIPGDTFYAYAGLEPVPESVVRSRLEEADNSFVSQILEGLQESNPQGNEFAKTIRAVLQELEGNLNPEGMKELGFSLEPHVALYGVGGMPVFRMKLGDAEAFRAMLNRVETKAGVDVRMKERDGTKYRLYQEEEVHFPVVIRDGALVASAYHEDASDVLLPYVLGQREPEESLADTGTIRKLVDKHDFEPHAVGFADIEGIALTATGVREPNAATKAVFKAGDFEVQNLSETCQKEIRGMTSRAPRFVFGSKQLSADEYENEFGLEVDEELGREIAGLTTPVPGIESEVFRQALFATGFGIDVQRLTSMLQKHATAITESPYECDQLQGMNRMARRVKNQPVPTVVSQLKGGTFILKDADVSGRSYRPKKLQAMGLVQMDNPQTLVGRLKSVVPGMMQANVKNNGVPVSLNQLSKQMPFLEAPHVALKDELFGFSTGVGMQDSMAAMLENPAAGATQTAAAFSYNLDKFRKAIPDNLKQMASGSMNGSFWSSAFSGRGELRLQFRESGVFVVARGERDTSDQGGESAELPAEGDAERRTRSAARSAAE